MFLLQTILALYPQTTCFYKGVIHEIPKTVSTHHSIVFGTRPHTNDHRFNSGHDDVFLFSPKYGCHHLSDLIPKVLRILVPAFKQVTVGFTTIPSSLQSTLQSIHKFGL